VAADDRLKRASTLFGLRPDQVEAALAYYAELTDEIDNLVQANVAAAEEVRRSSGGGVLVFQSLGDPHLDDRLTSQPKTLCLPVERLDHPHRKVHRHPTVGQPGAYRRSEVKGGGDVLPAIEQPIEVLSLHRGPPPRSANDER
jgi:hypothetical protein